jgi:hypothetical protein
VLVDFNASDAATDPAIVKRARQLSDELQSSPQPPDASPPAAEEMEAAFEKRVQYVATVESEYHRAWQIITTLRKENAGRTTYMQKLIQRLRAR